MRLRLTAHTEFGTLILLDPASVPAGTVTFSNLDPMIDAFSLDGRGIFYFSDRGGAYVDFLIVVGEPLEDRLQLHRESSVTDAFLRVPSGRIILICLDEITGDYLSDPTKFAAGTFAEISEGDYHVDAFDLNWGNEFEEECSRRAVPGDVRIQTLLTAMMDIAIFSTWFVAPVACLLWCINSRSQIGLLFLLGTIAISTLFWRLTSFLTKRSAACQRMQALREAIRSEFPDVVIVLRRCADSDLPTTITPGKFGAGC